MIKIGILPTTLINKDENPYNDIYMFHDVIVKRVYEVGALPVGILLNNGKIDTQSLSMCDAFIIGGGRKIEPYFFEAINYAIVNNKPLLGICLGMQAIAVYSYLETLLEENGQEISLKNLYDMYNTIKKQEINFLMPVENHYNEKITRSNYYKNKHSISINRDSKLYDIYNSLELSTVSMHRYVVNKYGKNVLINCTFNDIIEGLEYKGDRFVLGVQWHPELEDENIIIFQALVNAIEKR